MEGSLSLRDDFVLSNLLPLSSFCGFIHVGFRIITLFVSDGTLLPTRPQPRFFPESTPLSCSLADQGIKIRIRKDIRVRKRPIAALAPPSDGGLPNNGETRKLDQEQSEDDPHAQQPHPPLPASSNATSGSAVAKRARHGTLTGPLHLVPGPASVASSDAMSAHTPVSANNNPGSAIALAGLPAWPTPPTLDPMLGMASATPGGIELPGNSALPHAHTHTHPHAHQTMGVGAGAGVGGQLLSAGGEPSSSGSASAAARRTGSQTLSPSASSYPSSSSSVGGMYERVNYDYEPASLRGTTSYDPQRPLGGGSGAGYESASGGSGRGGYDTGGARGGYESGAGGGRGFEHTHQHHPRGSYDPRGGYEASQAPSRAPYNAHPHTQNQPHTEVHGHPSRASFNAPYEAAQAYQDGQQHHGAYAHPQQTSTSYASTGSHPHPSASHHPQQGQYPSPSRSQYPGSAYPGSYARYDVGANTNPNVNPNPNANAIGPGTGGSGGYYDNSSSSSPHPHSHAYYATGTSGQAQAQPSQIAPPPPLTHTASYASSGSSGSPYEYSGQGQGHGSSSSAEYYTQGHGHGHPGRVASPGPNATRYSGSSYASGAPSGPGSGWGPNGGHAHGLGQQEMIHLAPLRHASGGVGGGASTSSSSSPSSPALPSVSVSGGYPMIQLSRAPFEQDGRGVGGKKSVLSIGSIISDGV
jgi:hypothetical protein